MVAVSALRVGSMVSPRSRSISPRGSPRLFLSSDDAGHFAALGCTPPASQHRSSSAISSRRPSYGDKIESPDQAGDMSARGKSSAASNISAAVVCSILEADDDPVAQQRLCSQVAELQFECDQLRAAGQEQEARIAQTTAQIAFYDHKCAGLNESLQRFRDQLLHENQDPGSDALEHEKEELTAQPTMASRAHQSLQDKSSTPLTCSHQAWQEGHSYDASGELAVIKAQLDAAALQLQAVETDRAATVATLECNLAARRDYVKEVSAEASSAIRDAWSAATELVDARGTLAAVEEAAADQYVMALDTSQGPDHVEAVDALQQLYVEASTCQRELSGLNESQCVLQYQISLERQLHCNDLIAAKRSRLELLDFEEQCAADSTEHDKQWRQREARAEMVQSQLQGELQNAQDVVSKSRESLTAIRSQLSELHRIGGTVEVSKQTAQATTSELDLKLSTQRASHGETLKRLLAVQMEQEQLQVESATAAIAVDERKSSSERRLRSLTLEVEELKHRKVEQTLAAAAHENHRRAVERCLRQEVSDFEKEWELQRDELELGNAALAGRTVQLHDEHRAAEADLEATQLALQAVLTAHAHAEQSNARQLQAALARSSEREHQRLLAELQAEAEDLRAEHGRLRGAIKRLEALNAGLRAQVHICQQQYAEGMSCSPGSLAISDNLASLSLSSPFRLSMTTSTAPSTSSIAPGRGTAPASPAALTSQGLMQFLRGELPRS